MTTYTRVRQKQDHLLELIQHFQGGSPDPNTKLDSRFPHGPTVKHLECSVWVQWEHLFDELITSLELTMGP